MAASFVEVAQQLARAAGVGVRGVEPHGADSLGEKVAPIFIDTFRNDDVLARLAPLRVGDGGHGALRNEVQDVLFGERFQRLIGLVGREVSVVGDALEVDVGVVGEQTAVVAQ